MTDRNVELFQTAFPDLNFRRADSEAEGVRYWNANVDALWRGWQAGQASLMARLPVDAVKAGLAALVHVRKNLIGADDNFEAPDLDNYIAALTQLLEHKV